MKSILNLLMIIIPSLLFSQTRIYKGFLDKYPITLITNSYSDGAVNAMYVYDNHDTPIGILGNYKNGKLRLTEKDKKDKVTAILEFSNYEPKGIDLTGRWINKTTSKEYTLKLRKVTDFNSYDSTTFSDLEILQAESTKTHYFKTIVSKKDNEMAQVIGLKIFEKKTDKLVQSFKIDCEYRYFNNVYIDDYNFDKIDDFSIFEASYAGPNTSNLYFLYNPKTQKYFLSDYEGTSLEFDSEKKLVYEHNQCCAGSSHMDAVYKIVNNKMVLIQKKCTQYDEKKDDFVEVKCD